MDIILKEDIENLGFKDELISVKPGFARNFLIPQGKAIAATSSNKKVWEENLRQRSHKETKIKEDLKKIINIFLVRDYGRSKLIFGSF